MRNRPDEDVVGVGGRVAVVVAAGGGGFSDGLAQRGVLLESL